MSATVDPCAKRGCNIEAATVVLLHSGVEESFCWAHADEIVETNKGIIVAPEDQRPDWMGDD